MKLWSRIALLVVLQLGALVAMVADKQWTLNTGTPVVLKTEPVDPRSLFMGDYARLAYPISRLALDGAHAVGGERGFARHDTVWVALQAETDEVRVVSVHHDRTSVPAGLLALKGEVQRVNSQRWDAVSRKSIKESHLQVRYGIEHYFVQEGTGQQVERPSGGEKVSIRVAIDSRGKAGILAVLFDGQERYRETLF